MVTVIRKRMMNFLKNTVFHLETDTEAVLHNDAPLYDFINKRVYKVPEGYVLSERGIIKLKGESVNDIDLPGSYYCDSCTELPVSGSCYMEVTTHPSSNAYTYQHIIDVNYRTEFARSKVGTWSEWNLIAGEVVLWSGAVSTETDITISMPINRFQTLVLISNDGYSLTAPVIKEKTTLMFVGSFLQPDHAVNFASAYLVKKDELTLTSRNSPTIVAVKNGTTPTSRSMTITKLIGRP